MQVSGFDDFGRLTPLRRLYPLPVRQASTLPLASFRFRHATDTLAVQLTFPLAEYVEDSHPQGKFILNRVKTQSHRGLSPVGYGKSGTYR